MEKNTTIKWFWVIIIGIFSSSFVHAQLYSQLPECTALAPYFELDLSGNPDSSYQTPVFNRLPGCCGNTDNNDDYVSFYVTLHPEVAMFELIVVEGYADPPGSGVYNIISGGMTTPGDCGAEIPGGAPICISGSGPHKITYRKPGSNDIAYIFRQIPKPIYPSDQPTRFGCTLPLPIYGLNNIAINAIAKSANCTASLTTLNTYMSCLNCDNPVFDPGANPSYPYTVTYQVTGTPQAEACGSYPTSGSFTITVYDELNISVTPNPAAFCAGGPGVNLTASADGGDGNYSFLWLNSDGDTVATTSSYQATSEGNFTAIVNDGLISSTCEGASITVPVDEGQTPIVNAGGDKTACESDPTVVINGSIQFANPQWVGGLGTFSPNRFTDTVTYTPTPTEIASGSVTLTLTSMNAGGGCTEQNDDVTIFYSPNMDITEVIGTIICYGQTTTLATNVIGGVNPINYSWNNGSSSSSISVSAGTYGLTVTDLYSCAHTEYFTVNQPTPIELVINSTDETLAGDDGVVNVSVSGGFAPYSINLVNTSNISVGSAIGNTLIVNNLPDGVYTANITDGNGCSVSSSTVVNTFACSGLEVTTSATEVQCYGESTGAVSALGNGGTFPLNYSYTWNTVPPQNSATVIDLSAGTYSVTLTDNNTGCFDIASVTIYQPSELTNTITQTDVTTEGGSDGTASANPQGGTVPYDYSWNTTPLQLSQTANGLSAGTYAVTVTDDNNCSITENVVINQPPCNEFLLAVNTTTLLCNGDANGSATVFIANGNPPFNILWSTGATNVTSISGLSAGNYSVTVSDVNCSTSKNFTLIEPDPLSLGLAPSNVTCFDGANGSIDLTVSGGTYPQYYYSWVRDGKVIAQTQDIFMLPPSTYTITVTDENGCQSSASIGITQPLEINLSTTDTDNPCFANSLGTIDASVSGGTLPYLYNWSGPAGYTANTQDLSNLAAGLYKLTVTDGNGCISAPIDDYISQPALLTAIASMTNQVTCDGGNDGAAEVIVNGGTLPYTYSWTGPDGYSSVIDSITGIAAGTYPVTVTDNQNCVAITSAIITTITDIINPTISCPISVTVNADNDLCIASSINLGTPVTADNCLVASVTNNAPASFPLGNSLVIWTVTDGAGNTAACSQSITVIDSQNPTIICPSNVTGFADPGVCNSDLSSITLGTPIYGDNCSVLSVNSNAPSTFNLGANTVTWTVTDGSGNITSCNQIVTILDNQNPSIICPATVEVTTGANNCIATGISLGTPVTTDNCSIFNITNNAPSVYPLGLTIVTWIVTDGSNNQASCTQAVTVTDIIPPTILCPATVTTNTNSGICEASSVVIGTPATADNCSILSLTNNAPNSFPLGTTVVTWTVTDGSTNTATCSQTVIVNDNQDPTITCNNQVTVSADLGVCTTDLANVNLGTPITSDNCSIATVANNAPASFPIGTTVVTWTVTDGAGNDATCTQNVTVIDDQAPVISNCPSNIIVGTDAGDCGAIVSWTVPSYNDNCGAAMNFTHVPGTFFPVGTTTVTYNAADGANNVSICLFTVTVNDTENPVMTCPPTISTCDPLVSFNLPIATDNCALSGSVLQTQGFSSGSVFPVGTTTNIFQVSDIHGNISTCSFDVIVFPVPVITLLATDVTCNALDNGAIDATLSVGTEPYVYNWSTDATTEDLTDLSPGTYTLNVVDENGCTAMASALIQEPAVLTLQAVVTHVSCFNSNDGSVDINVNGGNIPYTYEWGNNTNSEDVSGLSGGAIDVTVTDLKGCQVTYDVTIEEPDSLMLSAITYAAQCGSETGSIILTVTGGTNPYDFSWSDGSDGINLYNVLAGDYSVTVEDANGCQNSLTATINAVNQLEAQLIIRDAKCWGENSGEIQAVVANGYAPFTYDWSNGQSTPTASQLVAAAYSLTITDSYGCEITLTADVNQPDSLQIELTSSVYAGGYGVSMYGGTDGYINANALGGISPYYYSWLGPNLFESNDQNIYGLSSGGYNLTVVDDNGCKASASVRITEPDILEMPNGFSPNNDSDNDFFEIHGIEAYPENDLVIYNRWGNLVYDIQDYQNQWNGENNLGEQLPDATYFAILQVYVNGEKIKTLTGYVDLRR